MQFYAANILSAAFIIGNPTNVIVGEAIGLTFGTFVQWMALPAIVAVFSSLFTLLYIFRNELTQTFVQPEMNPYDALIDPNGAIIQSLILLATLIAFPIANVYGGRIWRKLLFLLIFFNMF